MTQRPSHKLPPGPPILGRWTDAAEALQQLGASSSASTTRRNARLRHAQILLDHLHDSETAQTILQQAIDDDPSFVEAKQALVRVAFSVGDWEGAQSMLEQIAAEDDPAVQAWAMQQLAEVARVGLRDDNLRRRYEREAMLQATQDPALLAGLVDTYRRNGDQSRLVETGHQLLATAPSAHIGATVRLALSRILLSDLKRPDQATEQLHAVLEDFPDNQDAHLLLAQAHEQRGDSETAATGYRRLLERDPACAEAYRGINRLMSMLGRPPLATAAVSALKLFGQATTSELEQVDALERPTPPVGKLDIDNIALPPELRELRDVIEPALPHLSNVYPLPLQRSLSGSQPAARAAAKLAEALGLSGVKLSVEGTKPTRGGLGEPVPIQISAEVAGRPNSSTFRFWVGRALAGAATAHGLLTRLSDAALNNLVEALCTPRPIDADVAQLRKQGFACITASGAQTTGAIDPETRHTRTLGVLSTG